MSEMTPEKGSMWNSPSSKLMSSAKIMILDDEPINMRVLELHLTEEGYNRFVLISDSTTAMEVLRSEKPDVLLLDLNMPKVSGLEILQEVRADKELNQLPVIVLTSSICSETKVQALELGATDFLGKPVHAVELALRMRNTLVTKAYERRLKHLDSLTSLPNRLYLSEFVHRLGEEIKDSNTHYAFVLVNLKRFKSVNDSYGSERGDDVLWAFSQRLKHAFVVSEDALLTGHSNGAGVGTTLILRLGGDRFGVFVASKQNPADDKRLLSCLTDLRSQMLTPFVIDSQKVYITISIGISTIGGAGYNVETLINHAETAMQQSLDKSNSSHSFFNVDMVSGAKRLMDIENAMHTALANNEMYLTFQPKVEVETGDVTGAEALLRWKHAALGAVSPVEFIPVSESTGLILSIGHWVLDQACRQAVLFRESGFPNFKIAVNVSVAQLYEEAFVDKVKAVLQITGLQSSALILEITENMIMRNAEVCIAKLAQLREFGIQISIDDFGTGYSSLSYLQRFPIDQLKVDQSFISQITSDDESSPIVKAVVTLAHDLKLGVVAEGVETETHLNYVRKLHCEEYQGYYKSKPVVAEDFMALLQNTPSQKAA